MKLDDLRRAARRGVLTKAPPEAAPTLPSPAPSEHEDEQTALERWWSDKTTPAASGGVVVVFATPWRRDSELVATALKGRDGAKPDFKVKEDWAMFLDDVKERDPLDHLLGSKDEWEHAISRYAIVTGCDHAAAASALRAVAIGAAKMLEPAMVAIKQFIDAACAMASSAADMFRDAMGVISDATEDVWEAFRRLRRERSDNRRHWTMYAGVIRAARGWTRLLLRFYKRRVRRFWKRSKDPLP